MPAYYNLPASLSSRNSSTGIVSSRSSSRSGHHVSLRKAGNAEGDRKSTEPEPEPEPESAKKPNEGPVLVHSLIARRLSVFGPTLFGGVGDGGVQSAEPMRYFWAIHPA